MPQTGYSLIDDAPLNRFHKKLTPPKIGNSRGWLSRRSTPGEPQPTQDRYTQRLVDDRHVLINAAIR